MSHTFTQSGLGEAPFSLCHPNDPQARENTAFFCEHCGTGLKNRFFVKSQDGKVSVVGIDCLQKTGDQGLIDGEKRLRNQLRHEAREAHVVNVTDQRKAQDRNRFDGKTREEVIEDLLAQIQDLKETHCENIYDHKAHRLLLSNNCSSFEMKMIDKAIGGEAFSIGMLNILVEIFAKKKSGARKNSKAYKEALPEAQALAESYQSLLETHAEQVEALKNQVRDLRMGL